ncbi:Uncharacterised protein [Phocoenobacter uteri]|uniref:Uncharacterized protein n=1 Tax=Phocoenobacter uteri TaxID=146806 RepID=A0A379CCI0_9PAST|nr:XcbB/CpsF family capsular polysaccharide biosynthesis protein [Phocoenobacter uteri]MDG6881407.1 hypothetical protein [Phocoenobacter uteri]SUB59435.1 Uncharacterised protein [Phocoenobacter uteri]
MAQLDLNQIQSEVLLAIKDNFDTQKFHTRIYSETTVAFEFLVKDYIIGMSYNIKYKKFSFFLRCDSKTNSTIYDNFIQFIMTTFAEFKPVAKDVEDRRIGFVYSAKNQQDLISMYVRVFTRVYQYINNISPLEIILRAEDIQDSLENFESVLNNDAVNYLGITNQEKKFFVKYARKDKKLTEIVYALNRKGFVAIEHNSGITIFRKMNKNNYAELLPYFSKSFNELNNVLYTIEKPKQYYANNNLVIIFPYTSKCVPDISERYYTHTAPFLTRSIPPNTYIVRICDLGDAMGSHGLNTQFDDGIEQNIQGFIQKIMSLYSIAKENVLLFGISSGATAALYHGLLGKYKNYSVEPFLGNMGYYDNKDPLFLKTLNTPVADSFEKLQGQIGKSAVFNEGFESLIISSPDSEFFYPNIIALKEKIPELSLVTYKDNQIEEHEGFSLIVYYLTYSFINNLLINIRVGDKYLDIT